MPTGLRRFILWVAASLAVSLATSASALPPPPANDPALGNEYPAAPIAQTRRVAVSAPRIALLVGNSTYGSNLDDLANPQNDVEFIGKKLDEAGFDIEIVHDADLAAMQAAVDRLAARLEATGPGTTVLFYYAGHGMNTQGENFLLPVKQDFAFQEDLPEFALGMSRVVQAIGLQQTDRFIFMYDACNTDPLPGIGMEMEFRRDWWDIEAEHMFVWSARRGQEALDGTGNYSPFAQTLGYVLSMPGLSIHNMQAYVRAKVAELSSGQQQGITYSTLNDEFFFLPPVPAQE